MPSIDDVYNQLTQINTNLQTVQNLLSTTNATVAAGFSEMASLTSKLVADADYGAQILQRLTLQADTEICILEHISQQTCQLLNQADQQTKLQGTIETAITALRQMYATSNPAAALEYERAEATAKRMDECCPPEVSPPPCKYVPCPAPPALEAKPPRDSRK